MSKDAVARALRDPVAVKPVGHKVPCAVERQVGTAQLQELLYVLPGLAQRLRPALGTILSDVDVPFGE